MDFEFTTEQNMLRDTIAKMMDKVATPEYIRRLDREQAYPYELYDAWIEMGLLRMCFPEEYGGLGGSVMDMVVIAEELSRKSFDFFTAFGGSVFNGLNLVNKGTEEQKQYWIPKLLAGEIRLSISMSEPDAGSDIGAMRTTAKRDGDDWVINGQKIWTSGAHYSDYAIIITRTDPTLPKHKGLTMFFLSMKSPGVEIRPIKQVNGQSNFNEVFFTDVRIPDSQRLGKVGDGWQVSLTTLMNERLSIGAGYQTGFPELFDWCCEFETANGLAIEDPAVRSKLAQWAVRASGLKYTGYRAISAMSRGEMPGPENSIGKLVGGPMMQDIAMFALDLQAQSGALDSAALSEADARFQAMLLRSPATRIEGGTDEILRNIIAERVLGLPADIRVDKNVPFNQIPARARH